MLKNIGIDGEVKQRRYKILYPSGANKFAPFYPCYNVLVNLPQDCGAQTLNNQRTSCGL